MSGPEPNVLIVDDDPAFREFARTLLRANGFSTQEAGNGREGQTLLATGKFDLLITDLSMPECEGIETIIAVRKACKNLPILAVSGVRGAVDYLDAARLCGATATLEKARTWQNLIRTVRHLLDLDPVLQPGDASRIA